VASLSASVSESKDVLIERGGVWVLLTVESGEFGATNLDFLGLR